MIIFKRSDDCAAYLARIRKNNHTLGFVPTMGALHKGHLALVNSSTKENDLTICSIFVNPTQFNNPDDLKKYPIAIEQDINLLEKAGCDILFLPAKHEIYPKSKKISVPQVTLHYLATEMEAAKRPGHFDGVMQVVHRLLQIIQPDKLYMGQKDYQQQLIISKLLKAYHPDIILCTIPTVREQSGLAMSSRNKRLSTTQRKRSNSIYRALQYISKGLPSIEIDKLLKEGKDIMESEGLKVEYLEIADAETLSLLTRISNGDRIVICTAAYVDDIRLIDNILWP